VKQKVSMTDIARRLQISQATVSYVLNGRKNGTVSEEVRSRVLMTAREMGYRPNRVAQALKGSPTFRIELFVHGYYPAYYARALFEFENQVRPSRYRLNVTDSSHWTGDDWKNVDSGWPIDGGIIFDAAIPEEAVTLLSQSHVPLVSLGVVPHTTLDHIRIDLQPALSEAMRHLAARGGRVAYLSNFPPDATQFSDPRLTAYREVMRESSLPEEFILTPDLSGDGTRARARETVSDYIKEHGCPNAIFCFNDERAIGTLAAVRDLGYRVPEDVLLIGLDGIDETAYHSPQLSTINYPIAEGARLSWQFLQHRIENPDAPLQSATLTAQLIFRESSRL
jgi:DNA-binding LacI/PurR family transcriptional regulator